MIAPDAPDLGDMPQVCVVYTTRVQAAGQREILLGRKKTGLGRGRLVGPGGKIEAGESPQQAAVREVREEVGIHLSVDSLTLVGDLRYRFPFHRQWSQRSWVFLARHPGEVPSESPELVPIWVPIDDLPFGEMWDDARYWLREALDGRFARATFTFGEDGATVKSSDHPGFPGDG